MDSVLLGSFPKRTSIIVGANDWRSDRLKKVCSPNVGSHLAVKLSRRGAGNILDRHLDIGFQQQLLKHNIRGFEERTSFHRGRNKKCLVNAASGHPLEPETGAYQPKNIWVTLKNALDAFYRFSRPHTVIGTALSIISVSLLAVENLSDISPLFFTGVLEAVVAALFMNIYIVGLNQLSDIDIDKVNKPYLPLASGEYSVGTGVMIVMSFSILSFWLGWIVGSWPLFWALFLSFVLGTAYSINLPLLRWKKFAVVAAMCILVVRAVIVQLAFFLHMQVYLLFLETHVFKRPAVFSRPLMFATAFMSFFSVVIALFKDIPDIDGDKIYGIRSFSVRLGQKRVLGHAILASTLWNRAKSVDLSSKAAITSFYMFIWKLFYAEYLLIPLVR
ncbi:hypothetical protein F2P56_025831 [Juglans regia]|uniref:Homogentisate phytyltransferase 1, chloroplastic n=1 Tax=Juglans regia TaxID=51240 RepID=A0A833TUV4_JUGRE|nr:hypothetical protein F2P56_025831 [Juglans regia]